MEKRKPGNSPTGKTADGKPAAISKDYPRVTLYVRPDLKEQIDILSSLRGKAFWQIAEEGFELVMAALTPDERKLHKANLEFKKNRDDDEELDI